MATAPPPSYEAKYKPEQNIAHQGQPMAHPGQPMAYPGQPMAQPGQPMVHTNQPVGYPGAPMMMQQPATNIVMLQPPAPVFKPSNYMTLAVLTCIFCNCPCGVLAMICSCMSDSSYTSGQVDDARCRGKWSCGLSITGILISIGLGIFLPIYFFVIVGVGVGGGIAGGIPWDANN